jgi:hypothetical protein
MKMNKLVATVALAGALTAGTAGVAYAAEDSGATSGKPAATAVKHPRLRLLIRHRAGAIVADTLGVSRQDLRAALKSGQTVNQYAATFGDDKPAAVKDALVNAANQALDKAVANGRIDQARADEIKAKVPARVDKAMNHVFGQGAGTPQS